MKPLMSAAPLEKRAQKHGSPLLPTNACSAAIAENDCGKKRDPRGDDAIGTEGKPNGA
jgi:hypothetical protein